MKPVAMFVLGAVLAAGLVYVVLKPGDKTPAPVQTAQQQVPAQPASQTPEANPEAVAPAPQPAPTARASEPERATPPAHVRKPSPAPRRTASPAPAAPQTPVKPDVTYQPEKPVTTAQNTPATPAAPVVETPQQPTHVEQRAPEPPPAPKTVTIPGGTLLTVRIDEALSSDRNHAGDSFRATLDQPLVVDGFVIAERGSRVEGRVAEIDEGGRVRGVARMSLELIRLNTSDGQRIKLQTESFAKQGQQSRGKDVAKVGAAAGIGAAIGAIAGGGKGAAIGAAVGGAAGTGGVMATRGEPVRLPAETRVSFRLSQPITITEKL